jgi:hypothetical protein
MSTFRVTQYGRLTTPAAAALVAPYESTALLRRRASGSRLQRWWRTRGRCRSTKPFPDRERSCGKLLLLCRYTRVHGDAGAPARCPLLRDRRSGRPGFSLTRRSFEVRSHTPTPQRARRSSRTARTRGPWRWRRSSEARCLALLHAKRAHDIQSPRRCVARAPRLRRLSCPWGRCAALLARARAHAWRARSRALHATLRALNCRKFCVKEREAARLTAGGSAPPRPQAPVHPRRRHRRGGARQAVADDQAPLPPGRRGLGAAACTACAAHRPWRAPPRAKRHGRVLRGGCFAGREGRAAPRRLPCFTARALTHLRRRQRS